MIETKNRYQKYRSLLRLKKRREFFLERKRDDDEGVTLLCMKATSLHIHSPAQEGRQEELLTKDMQA